MCVIGAGRRARRGESVDTILAAYYPGLTVSRLGNVPEVVAATPVAVAPGAFASSLRGLTVRVPNGSSVSAPDLQRLAVRAQESLARTLGASAAPMAIELHETLDSFRAATSSPWWVNAVVTGTTIDLAPAALLAQRGGVEAALQTAMAELVMRVALVDRPAWVRVGGARYFARSINGSEGAASPSGARVRCPADAELTLAISAGAQRDAESRAEACFARAVAQTKDWRAVR